MNPPCLLAIDGTNLLRTVFEANPDPNPATRTEAACKSAISTFRRALKTHKPAYAVAAFDHGGDTWRHRLFPSYREGRAAMPGELRSAIPGFRDQLETQLGLASISLPDVEADDVLATLAARWEQGGGRGKCVIISGDKDLAGLTRATVAVYNIFKMEWRDDAWCLKRFGVPTAKLLDYLALIGDTTDGVPGVPKIGAKTGAKLLNDYGSLEAILSIVETLPGAAAESLKSNRELAVLCRRLVSMREDLVLGLRWSELLLQAPTPRRDQVDA